MAELLLDFFYFFQQGLDLHLINFVVLVEGAHFLVVAGLLAVDRQPVVVLGENPDFEFLQDLEHKLMLLGNPRGTVFDGSAQDVLVGRYPGRIIDRVFEFLQKDF